MEKEEFQKGHVLTTRPHKKNYLFSVPARPERSARPNFFLFLFYNQSSAFVLKALKIALLCLWKR